jgi:hypothetical protein
MTRRLSIPIETLRDITYDGDLSAEMSFDISCFDSIWRIF